MDPESHFLLFIFNRGKNMDRIRIPNSLFFPLEKNIDPDPHSFKSLVLDAS
jgi:hypothetical protein